MAFYKTIENARFATTNQKVGGSNPFSRTTKVLSRWCNRLRTFFNFAYEKALKSMEQRDAGVQMAPASRIFVFHAGTASGWIRDFEPSLSHRREKLKVEESFGRLGIPSILLKPVIKNEPMQRTKNGCGWILKRVVVSLKWNCCHTCGGLQSGQP